jgi:hypothetical protein
LSKKKPVTLGGRRALAGIPGRAFLATGWSERRPCPSWPHPATGPLSFLRSLVDVSKEPNATQHQFTALRPRRFVLDQDLFAKKNGAHPLDVKCRGESPISERKFTL